MNPCILSSILRHGLLGKGPQQALKQTCSALPACHTTPILISTTPFSSILCTAQFSSSSYKLVEKEGEAQPSRRTHMMMIDGVVTSIASGQSSSNTRLGSRGANKAGSQLLMDKDGTVSSHSTSSSDSSESDKEDFSFEHKDRDLLEAALRHVRESGWTELAVRQGAQDLGLSQSSAAKFERPEAALVSYFVERCNAELAHKLKSSKQEFLGMRTQERVRTAIQWRLEMNIPYMDSWSQALAIQASPGSLPSSLKHVSKLVDEIWYACGDTSTDLSWYTKRATLAGVYAAIEAFMLSDYSPGYADSWEALDRAMKDVAQLGKLRNKAQSAASQAFQSAFSLIERTTKREAF